MSGAYASAEEAEQAVYERRLADQAPAGGGNPLVVIRLADVAPERVRWLWPSWIPLGKLTMLDGDPGLGKSTLTLDLAARVSTGSPLPDGEPVGAKGAVLVASAEDGIADTLRPRVAAAGGDLSRVVVLDHVAEAGGSRPLVLPDDLDHVEGRALELGAVLIVIDPFMAYLSGAVDSHRDQDVRRAMHRMKEMAERTGAAVLTVRHFTKSEARAVHKGGGSVGISGAARSLLMVAADPDDEALRVYAVIKSNLAAVPKSLAYRVVGDELHDCARIAWQGTSGRTADELTRQREREERLAPKLEAAEARLERMLADGPRLRADIEAAAQEDGVSWRTVERAKKHLGVEDGQRPEPGRQGAGPSWWWLPQPPQGWPARTPTERPATPKDSQVGGPFGGAETAGHTGSEALNGERSATSAVSMAEVADHSPGRFERNRGEETVADRFGKAAAPARPVEVDPETLASLRRLLSGEASR
jgi:AAA domain